MKMDERSACFSEMAESSIVGGAYKVTQFLNEKLTVKATRKRYQGKIYKGHAIDIVFTVGKPNCEERERIKRAKQAGEPITMTITKTPPSQSEELKRKLARAQKELADAKQKREKLIRSI
jgi:hypothetical protein